MKRIFALTLIIIMTVGTVKAQYKGYDDKGKSDYNTSGNMLLGFINPNNFSMNHNFSVSMVNGPYGAVSLTSYINTMNYRFSKDLNVSADVKFQYSPYASSRLGTDHATALQNNLSGVFLSRASLNYQISDNAYLNLEYRRLDESDYFNNMWNPYYYSGFSGFGSVGLK